MKTPAHEGLKRWEKFLREKSLPRGPQRDAAWEAWKVQQEEIEYLTSQKTLLEIQVRDLEIRLTQDPKSVLGNATNEDLTWPRVYPTEGKLPGLRDG